MNVRREEQGSVLHAALSAKAGSVPRQARGMLRAKPMGGADQSDVSERFS